VVCIAPPSLGSACPTSRCFLCAEECEKALEALRVEAREQGMDSLTDALALLENNERAITGSLSTAVGARQCCY
jgi:hypothetical protein